MGFTKKELIEKLKSISSLYDDVVEIEEEMEEFEPEDIYEREVILPKFPGKYNSEEERRAWAEVVDHSDEYALEGVKKAHIHFYAPKKPAEPKLEEFKKIEDKELKNKEVKFKGFSGLAAGISIFFVLGILLNLDDEYSVLPTMITIAVVSALLFVVFRFISNSAKKASDVKNSEALLVHTHKQDEIISEHNARMKAFEKEYEAYELRLNTFMNEYAEWRKIYIEQLNEEAEIEEKLEEDRVAGANKIYDEKYVPAKNKLDKLNDLISDEYLPVLDDIIDFLESNRADDLKEAINLYEEIAYRERQLELQREIEEQRIYEEELRRQEEARRYQQEMEYREEQERQRRYEEERREREAERRHKEEMDQREREARNREYQERERIRKEELKAARIEREQKEKQWQAAKKQCQHCAHVGRCSMSVYNNTPNCTGFSPK